MTWAQTIVGASHCVGLTFAGHDRAAGLVLRQGQLADARARSAAEDADVVGVLLSATAVTLNAPDSATTASWAASAANLLAAVTNGSPVIVEISRGDGCSIKRMAVESGADCGAAAASSYIAGSAACTAPRPARTCAAYPEKLLAQGQRVCVHQDGCGRS